MARVFNTEIFLFGVADATLRIYALFNSEKSIRANLNEDYNYGGLEGRKIKM